MINASLKFERRVIIWLATFSREVMVRTYWCVISVVIKKAKKLEKHE